MSWLKRLFRIRPKHAHGWRYLFGSEIFAVYGCDECGKAHCIDKFGVTDCTRDLPAWQVKYPIGVRQGDGEVK